MRPPHTSPATFISIRVIPGKGLARQPEPAERIAPVGVETGRDDEKLGGEAPEGRLRETREVGLLGRSRRKRQVQSRPQPLALAPFVLESASRIKRVLVERDEEHLRILPENVLGPVPVMNIPVQDGHPVQPMFFLNIAGENRGGGEEAKPHGTKRLGMLAGRAHRAKSRGVKASHYLVRRRQRRVHRSQRGAG